MRTGAVAERAGINVQTVRYYLEEIRQLPRLREPGARDRRRTRGIAEAKLLDIERKLERLVALRRAPWVLIERRGCPGSDLECPILEALNGAGPDVAEPGRVK